MDDDGFRVRLVRARQMRSAALQALGRPLRLHVLPNELRLSAASAKDAAPTILRFFAAPPPARDPRVWLRVRMAQVKRVRVKRRLLRVTLHDDRALTLCMENPSDALDAATAMMHAWGVEPLVETKAAPRAPLTQPQLAALFLESPRFRSLVHAMHARIASLAVVSTSETIHAEDEAASSRS